MSDPDERVPGMRVSSSLVQGFSNLRIGRPNLRTSESSLKNLKMMRMAQHQWYEKNFAGSRVIMMRACMARESAQESCSRILKFEK